MSAKRTARLLLAALAFAMAACGPGSVDVPSLNTEGTSAVEPAPDYAPVLDDEGRVMAFSQGIEYKDPVVDSDGNVLRPELAGGATVTRAELAESYGACAQHLEGVSFARERQEVSGRLDEFVALAACLRGKGYDFDDPTAGKLDQWLIDFRVEFDWDDPDAKAAYDECISED